VEGYRSYPDPGPGYQEGWHTEQGYSGEARAPAAGDYVADQRWAEERRTGEHSGDFRRPEMDTGRMAVGPRSGLPIPDEPLPRRDDPVPRRQSLVAPASPGPATGMYRSKRPAVAALFGLAAAILEIPALLLLREGVFGSVMSASGVVGGACLVAALPLLAVGLHGVATGAVRAAGPNSGQAWLRPPVAYVTVGLVLLLAAGLAA
jgi:hypothetical protein